MTCHKDVVRSNYVLALFSADERRVKQSTEHYTFSVLYAVYIKKKFVMLIHNAVLNNRITIIRDYGRDFLSFF